MSTIDLTKQSIQQSPPGRRQAQEPNWKQLCLEYSSKLIDCHKNEIDNTKRLVFLSNPDNKAMVTELLEDISGTDYHTWCEAIDSLMWKLANGDPTDEDWDDWDVINGDEDDDIPEFGEYLWSGLIRALVGALAGDIISPFASVLFACIAFLATMYEWLNQ